MNQKPDKLSKFHQFSYVLFV